MSTKTAIQRWLQPGSQSNETEESPPATPLAEGNEHNHQLLQAFRPKWTGLVKKEGHVVKNWKERFFVIINDLMIYYKTERDYQEGLSPLGYHVVLDVTQASDSKTITATAQCSKVFKLITPSVADSSGLLPALKRACVATATSQQTQLYSGHSQLQLVL
jgi:hypothetical protein